MNKITENFGADPTIVASQIASLLHIVLACAATVAVLRKGKELSFGIFVALLVAWLVPLLGPVAVLLGLRSPETRKVA